ncbi:hypothetical protein ACX12M_17215 [Cellulosimicrobium cellulans]
MAQHDTDAEVVEAVRSTIDDQFSRFLGQLTGTGEAVEFVETLERKGVVLVPVADAYVAEDEYQGPPVTIHVNVAAGPDEVSVVLDQLVQADVAARRGRG